jgi:ABC-2 type transport system ATP-binding protein
MKHTPAISVHAVSKHYGRTQALKAVDLEVPAGSALALIGRNGAGKSTLIRILMGFFRPTCGEVKIFGKPVTALSESDRAAIAYIADNQNLPEGMTIAEYLAFLRPLYSTWDDAFCQKLLELFDLSLDRKIRNLSRGQRVKAAFTGALSFHPRLLIMDEPFAGLDPAVRDEVLDALFELMNREAWSILVSSHEIDEVERLADLVVVLDEGKAVISEEKDTLLSRCRSVSLHSSASIQAADLPAHWWNARGGEGRFTFVDSEYDSARFAADVPRFFPDATHVAVEPAPLKTITRALLRHND